MRILFHSPLLLLLLLFSLFTPNRAAFAQTLTSEPDLLALYRLRSSLGIRALHWPRKSDPCSAWTGVGCHSGRVVSLTLTLTRLKRTRLGRRNRKFAVDGIRNLTRLESFDSTRFALPGPIPDWFGQLTISSLILRGATVTGDIPYSLGDAGNLTALDLSSNFLTGGVPESVWNLASLKALNLSSNVLTGSIPITLGNVTALNSLYLCLNKFSGRLPDSLWSLQNLQYLDLSYNYLTGELTSISPVVVDSVDSGVFNLSNNFYYGSISSGFARFVVSRFGVVDLSDNYFEGLVPIDNGSQNLSIESNCFRNALHQRRLMECQGFYSKRGLIYDGVVGPTPPPSPSRSLSKWKWIVVGVIGSVFILVVAGLVVLCIVKFIGRSTQEVKQGETNVSVVSQNPVSGVSPPEGSIKLGVIGEAFTFEQLVQATSKFSDGNLIRHRHSGNLYRGVLEGGILVVVKRVDLEVVKKTGYALELEFFSKHSHQRMVPFLGHCLDNENGKFLVYKYMSHGDLSNALYIKSGVEEEGLQSLDWITRLKIAIGVAEALYYLHHECTPPLDHRDVQASSILLDDKYEVRLGSLSGVSSQEGESHQNVITRLLRLSSQTSEQSASGPRPVTCAYDVYCLGKVLLELVTGKLGLSGSNNSSTTEQLDHILKHISIYEKELVTKVVDPSLIVNEDLLEEVWAMAIVAKSCLNPKPSKRPLVKYILKALENPLKVVREDSTGSARLRAGSSLGSWNATLFGSWRRSSSDTRLREERNLRRSRTMRSHGSGGEQPFNYRRPSREIFPEPFSGQQEIEE